MRINVLTPGFTTSNSSAFLFPFVVHNKTLMNAQFDVQILKRSSPNITNCDVLAIDSKEFLNDWSRQSQSQTLDLLESYQNSGATVIWFDTTDSSGTLQSQVFPFVQKYLKSQVLIDKIRYTDHIYGGRVYSDYYKNTFGITDEVDDALDNPITSADVQKLGVSWNSGLADYSTYGPWKIALYRRFGLSFLLRHPKITARPTATRNKVLSARFGATYARATVRYQREQIRKILANEIDTQKIGRRGYMKELNNTKVVLSPFGWGEITLKDFEVFLTGGMLLKPKMDHIQTWPNFYERDVTYMAHDWELDDLEEKIEWAVSNDGLRQEIALQAQLRYVKHTSGPNAGDIFVRHLSKILSV